MSNNIIDQVIEKADIIQIIGTELDLTPKGSNYVSLCPFHDDNSPSFTVSPEKKMYKCFACGEGGNVITFVEKYNKIPFKKALEIVANEVGIKYSAKVVKTQKENELLLYAKDIYEGYLSLAKDASHAREYLSKRNISDEMIKEFGIGYAPKSENIFTKYYSENLQDKYNIVECENTGLINNSNDTARDYFYDRIMIPIINEDNLVVGFSGRVLSDAEPKYLNSKTSNIFEKSKVLYNMNIAANNIENETIYIVEGFFDVFSFAKMNVKNVVATMGTALTINHINLLKKIRVNKCILAMDQDDAGKKAMLDVGQRLFEMGISNVDVILYDKYKDIDEYVSNENDVNTIINNRKNFFEFKMIYLQNKYNVENMEQRANYIKEILNGIEYLEANLRNIVLTELSNKTGIGIELLEKSIKTMPVDKSQKVVNDNYGKNITNDEVQEIPIAIKNKLYKDDEDYFIKYCLSSKENFNRVNDFVNNNNFKFNTYDILFNELKKYYSNFEEFDLIDFDEYIQTNYYYTLDELLKNKAIDIDNIELVFDSINKPRGGLKAILDIVNKRGN